MKTRLATLSTKALIFVGLATGPSFAQTGVTETTVEAHVAQSSLIVRATVQDVKIESIDPIAT